MIVSALLMLACVLMLCGAVVSKAIGNVQETPIRQLYAYGMATLCYWMAIGLFFISLAVALLHRLGVIDGGNLSAIF